MKKMIVTMALTVAGLLGVSAQASEVQKPLWDCAMTFSAKGGGVQVLVGHFALRGQGHIRCVDIAGNTEVIPVKVTIGGGPVAANVGFGHFEMAGMSSGIGVATSPEALLGKYYALNANAGVIVGAGMNLAMKGGAEAATINLSLSVLKGFGAQVGIDRIKLERL